MVHRYYYGQVSDICIYSAVVKDYSFIAVDDILVTYVQYPHYVALIPGGDKDLFIINVNRYLLLLSILFQSTLSFSSEGSRATRKAERT